MPEEGVSMPPNPIPNTPIQEPPAAKPYNPAAQEELVQSLHPAAQYAYQRARTQGADPHAAYENAMGMQNQMIQRATEGQNVEGWEQPTPSQYSASFVDDSVIRRVKASLDR